VSEVVFSDLVSRLATDEDFAAAVAADPATLLGFDLSDAERTALTDLTPDPFRMGRTADGSGGFIPAATHFPAAGTPGPDGSGRA
jgi:hypothetical protein